MNVVALSAIRIGCPLPNSSGRRLLIAAPENTTGSSTSSGAVPVWVDGVASADGSAVTPMGLADIQPPLHFAWSLSPPMPNAPAELQHWLSQLQVDPDDVRFLAFRSHAGA